MTNGDYDIQFFSLEDGWLCIRLLSGETELKLCPEGFMQDSLLDTVQAITAIWNGRRDEVIVQWYDLPALIEFHFCSEGDKLVLCIEEYPEAGRHMSAEKQFLLECRDSHEAMCLKFWRALRKLESQIVQSNSCHAGVIHFLLKL